MHAWNNHPDYFAIYNVTHSTYFPIALCSLFSLLNQKSHNNINIPSFPYLPTYQPITTLKYSFSFHWLIHDWVILPFSLQSSIFILFEQFTAIVDYPTNFKWFFFSHHVCKWKCKNVKINVQQIQRIDDCKMEIFSHPPQPILKLFSFPLFLY